MNITGVSNPGMRRQAPLSVQQPSLRFGQTPESAEKKPSKTQARLLQLKVSAYENWYKAAPILMLAILGVVVPKSPEEKPKTDKKSGENQ